MKINHRVVVFGSTSRNRRSILLYFQDLEGFYSVCNQACSEAFSNGDMEGAEVFDDIIQSGIDAGHFAGYSPFDN